MNKLSPNISSAQSQEIALYKSEDGQISFNVNVFDETVWLSQKQMTELFGRDQSVIARHINNIFKEGELDRNSVYANFAYTAADGKEYEVGHYSLDVIISVGYRVKSQRGVQFRKWATKILKQYLMNGYSVNEIRIKQIESSINDLVAADKIKTKEIEEIRKLLKSLVARPIIINNNLSIGRLERKIIDLIDEIILDLKSKDREIKPFEKARDDVQKLSKDKKARNRVMKFIKDLGDDNSDISNSLKGIKKIKKGIRELIRLLNSL